MNTDLLRFKKIIAYLSKRHSQTFMARQRTWRRVLNNYALCDGKITLIISIYFTDANTSISSEITKDLKRYINWLRTFPSNIEIQNKIYNDFKTIIVILYINYLKEKNIYNNFINCLKTTTCSHHCNEIDTYVKKFIEDDIILDFIASAFIFDSTPLGWNFWHKHYENARVYVNSFLYSV